jgi:hypothetical protein
MMITMPKVLWAVPLLLALSGCSSLGVFRESDTAAAPAPTAVEPPSTATARLAQEPQDLVPAPASMQAASIRQAVSGKTFRWQGPNNSGTTLFAQDGTSLIEVDGKGTAQGTWQVRDGQLCETIKPGSAVLPKGSPLRCNPFSGAGGRYKVGPATFTAS